MANALKTYYVATEGLDVYYGEVMGTEVQNKHRGVISFARGMYQTADPDKQKFLDNYPGCVSEEVWKKSHIPAAELKDMEKRENERLQIENNRLLAEVQALKGKK